MGARVITNLLLAIIAGVLLFGKEAMVSGIQWIAIAGIVIGGLFGTLMLASYIIGEVFNAYRETKNWSEVGLMTAGFALMAIVVPLFGYTGWLWFTGVEAPLDAAMQSAIGKVWTYAFFGGIVVVAFVLTTNGLTWIFKNRADLPAYGMMGAKWLGTAAVAPVLFPIREWHLRTQEGSNIAVRIVSSAYATLIGLGLWTAILIAVLGVGITISEAVGWI